MYTCTHTHVLSHHFWGNLHFLVIEQHAVDFDDGHISGLLRLKVNKPIPLGLALVVQHHLTGKDVPKRTERIVESFVVNGLVKVLDEDVAHTRSSEGGVTLRPHEPHRVVLDRVKVHGVQGPLSCEGRRRNGSKIKSRRNDRYPVGTYHQLAVES